MILHQNIQGLLSKKELIEVTLSELKNDVNPDVLCFSETFVKNGEEKNINIHNYELAAHYSRNKKRGGTCILVKKGLSYNQLNTCNAISANFHFECCSIKIPNHNIIIICVYRSSTATKKRHYELFLEKFEQLMNKYLHKYPKQRLVVLGDININTLLNNNVTRYLSDILKNYNLTQHITVPTRGLACIDHIFSNVKNATGGTRSLLLSDHDTAQILHFNVKLKNLFEKPIYTYKRDYSSENIERFKFYLSSLSFSEVYSSQNTNEAFGYFYDWFCLLYKLCFPLCKVRLHAKPLKWISKGIKKSCVTSRILRLSYYKKRCENAKYKYQNYSKLLKKCILKAKKQTNNKYVLNSENKCKATWRIIQDEIITKPLNNNNYINSIQYNNNTIDNPIAIANIFNNNFVNLTNKSNSNLLNDPNSKPLRNSIYLSPVDEFYVKKIIDTLNNTGSEGHDNICTKVLKSCSGIISPVLTYLINLSLSTGVFPDYLKVSVVKPLHKKGDRTNISNFRPITLQSVFSKVYERVMHDKLVSFFNKYHVLKTNQYGFQKNKSTTEAIFNLLHKTLTSLNDNKFTTCLFFDMSKAFDFVAHNQLLQKLDHCGIRGVALKLIETYLENRTQSVEITKLDNLNVAQKYFSGFQQNKYGVPQGSVLGPLLFLIYINNLADVTKHPCILFADDVSVIVSTDKKMTINEHVNDINKTIISIVNWLNNNNLIINVDKTYYMNFNNISDDWNINCSGKSLKSVQSVKFLGVEIDSRLDWKKHVEDVCGRINRFSFALHKLTRVATRGTALTAYHAYIESVLRYGLIIWGNSTDNKRAFIAQKKCIRAIYGAPPDEPCKPLFKSLSILPLPCLYIFESAKFVKQNLHYFKTAKDIYSRSTRNTDRLVSEFCPKSTRFKKNCYWMCITLYNKIPKSVQELPLNRFKVALYRWLNEKAFYSVTEYLNYEEL